MDLLFYLLTADPALAILAPVIVFFALAFVGLGLGGLLEWWQTRGG